ncbi:MAG: type IV pilus modification protein PilV [Gammaproteobacteria bacterium]|jgi:type IV pilus assembly protein PilV
MRASHGFSLLEVLVAIVVVATGVLGVAALQIMTMQNNTSALFRTQATQLAYDIIDRARANPDGDYAVALADAAPAIPNCMSQDCAPAEMSDYDLGVWLSDVITTLPDGDGEITMNGNLLTVTVQWDDSRDALDAPLRASVTTALAP